MHLRHDTMRYKQRFLTMLETYNRRVIIFINLRKIINVRFLYCQYLVVNKNELTKENHKKIFRQERTKIQIN